MNLIGIIVTLVVVGLVLWLINGFIPMEPKIKQLLNVVVIIILVIWLLQMFFGVFGAGTFGHIRVG